MCRVSKHDQPKTKNKKIGTGKVGTVPSSLLPSSTKKSQNQSRSPADHVAISLFSCQSMRRKELGSLCD